MSRKLTKVALVLCAAALAACGPEAENAGARLKPHLSPVSLGDLYPLPSGESPDYGSSLYVPYAWTLLLQSVGTETVTIDSVCIVGDDRGSFSLEGPDERQVSPGREAAVRITFDNTSRSPGGEPENAAVVIQSDAIDFPTLVVPICGRIIADGEARGPVQCTSPVQVAAGERDETLCGG